MASVHEPFEVPEGKFKVMIAYGSGGRFGYTNHRAFEVDPTTTTVEQFVELVKATHTPRYRPITYQSFQGVTVDDAQRMIIQVPAMMALNGTYIGIHNGARD